MTVREATLPTDLWSRATMGRSDMTDTGDPGTGQADHRTGNFARQGAMSARGEPGPRLSSDLHAALLQAQQAASARTFTAVGAAALNMGQAPNAAGAGRPALSLSLLA